MSTVLSIKQNYVRLEWRDKILTGSRTFLRSYHCTLSSYGFWVSHCSGPSRVTAFPRWHIRVNSFDRHGYELKVSYLAAYFVDFCRILVWKKRGGKRNTLSLAEVPFSSTMSECFIRLIRRWQQLPPRPWRCTFSFMILFLDELSLVPLSFIISYQIDGFHAFRCAFRDIIDKKRHMVFTENS